MKEIYSNFLKNFKKFFQNSDEKICNFTAKDAYFVSTYGRKSSKEKVKKEFLQKTNELIQMKSRAINSACFCCTEIPKEILCESKKIKEFYENQGFSVFLITKREVDDMQETICLFLSWKYKY